MRNGTQPRDDEREERLELIEVALGLGDELPNLDDRLTLARAIADGAVEHLYRPCAASYHNATIPGLPAWVDPRITVTDWAALTRDGLSADDIRTVMIERGKARGGA